MFSVWCVGNSDVSEGGRRLAQREAKGALSKWLGGEVMEAGGKDDENKDTSFHLKTKKHIPSFMQHLNKFRQVKMMQ